jgi:hypothetical protein
MRLARLQHPAWLPISASTLRSHSRRIILTYEAAAGNEGYELICLHPDPRQQPGMEEKAQIRVQVKSG